MPEDRYLDAATLLTYIAEVADELPDDGHHRCLVVAGGALLAWHGLRDATRDVDSVTRLDQGIIDAVATVAARHDLAPRWLNDAAAAFVPAGFDPTRGTLIWSSHRLHVVGAPLDQVFLMKLHAGRSADTPDLRALWPHTGFATPQEATAAYYNAYPIEEHDEHFVAWVADQIR